MVWHTFLEWLHQLRRWNFEPVWQYWNMVISRHGTDFRVTALIARFMGPIWDRQDQCWPHELCYLGGLLYGEIHRSPVDSPHKGCVRWCFDMFVFLFAEQATKQILEPVIWNDEPLMCCYCSSTLDCSRNLYLMACDTERWDGFVDGTLNLRKSFLRETTK